jgi:hypothetical protein
VVFERDGKRFFSQNHNTLNINDLRGAVGRAIASA